MPQSRNFAETFEALKGNFPLSSGPLSRWPEDRQRSERQLTVLLDGFNSNSWTHISTAMPEQEIGRAVRPFSYYAPGVQYYWYNTWQSLPQHGRRLARHYIVPRDRQTIVPIGASGGGVITLLGAGVWIADHLSKRWTIDRIVSTIPAVILIAPALCPPARLLSQYEEIYEVGLRTGEERIPEVPLAVRQLCDQSDELGRQTRARVISAVNLLQNVGVAVHLIYWNEDKVCPYPCDDAMELQNALYPAVIPHEVSPKKLRPPTNEMEAVISHVKFLRHADVVSEVRDILLAIP